MQALEPGLMFAARYRLVDLLGSGGMSQVWRAQDQVLGRLVAVKVLSADLVRDESTRDLLRREARAMAMVSDPHVANIHDYGEYDADGEILPFVVMELVLGRTLAQALRHGPLPWPEAVRMAAQVASGLAAAHQHGVIHCDVTPGNVVLTRAGVKVVDFGIATVLGASRTRTRFGTAGYVAPEGYKPHAQITPAADVYSLGVVLYEALTGRTLHDPGQLAGLVPGLPPDVVELCRRSLAEPPASRPHASEIAAALAAVPTVDSAVSSAGAVAVPPSSTRPLPTTNLRRPPWRQLVVAAAIGLAIAVVAALALIFGRNIQVATAPELSSTASASNASASKTTPAPRPVTTAPTGHLNRTSATANLRQVVLAGQAAGEIRPQCAEGLLSRIADLQRRIDRGDSDNARQRIDQIGEEIDERVSNGDVTRSRAFSLRQALAAVVI